MAMTPTHDNSLLKGKLPSLNPNNITNLGILTDGLIDETVSFPSNNSITYDLGVTYDITHYVFSNNSSAFKIQFLDNDSLIISELSRTGANATYDIILLTTPLPNVRYIKIINTSTSNSSISELGVWGEVSTINKILFVSKEGKTNSLIEGEGLDLIPIQTNNNPSIIFSSQHTTYKAFQAFNKDYGELSFWSTLSGQETGWIGFNFGIKTKVSSYIIQSRMPYLKSSPNSWTFEGSNDGANWTVLDTRTGYDTQSWSASSRKEFRLERNYEFSSYRLNASSNNGDTNYPIQIISLELLIYPNPSLFLIPSNSEENFVKYGMDSPVKVNGFISSKSYILSKELENAEGLWTTKINRKPLSIKFN